MKIVKKGDDLIGYIDSDFHFSFSGFYKIADDKSEISFYGLITSSIYPIIFKDDGLPLILPCKEPILFTLPLVNKEINYKDKVTGEQKSFTRKTKSQYQVLAKVFSASIDSSAYFSGVITDRITQGLADVILTEKSPIDDTHIDDLTVYLEKAGAIYQLCYEDTQPTFENKLLVATNQSKGYQKTYVSESEKIKQRFDFLNENLESLSQLVKEFNVYSAKIGINSNITIFDMASLVISGK
jgi:hypothetical protein